MVSDSHQGLSALNAGTLVVRARPSGTTASASRSRRARRTAPVRGRPRLRQHDHGEHQPRDLPAPALRAARPPGRRRGVGGRRLFRGGRAQRDLGLLLRGRGHRAGLLRPHRREHRVGVRRGRPGLGRHRRQPSASRETARPRGPSRRASRRWPRPSTTARSRRRSACRCRASPPPFSRGASGCAATRYRAEAFASTRARNSGDGAGSVLGAECRRAGEPDRLPAMPVDTGHLIP